jgi:hypothetical protein
MFKRLRRLAHGLSPHRLLWFMRLCGALAAVVGQALILFVLIRPVAAGAAAAL